MANKKFSQFTDVISISPNIFIVGYDSVLNDNIRILSTDLPAIIGAVTGSGTAGKLPKWLTATELEDSLISDDGTEVTIAGNINATAFIKVGGTSSQFLKADGSVDSNTYITLTSLSASAPLSYNNLTGEFSISQASATADGYLSSVNWVTFNSKQNALIGTGIVKSTSGAISYITDNSGNWNTAYDNMIISASVTGTTTKTLTLNQQDGGTITASWTDINTDAVTSVFGRTGAVIAQSGDYSTTLVTEGTNLYFTNARARSAFSSTVVGLTYDSITGVLSTASGYAIPTTISQANWDTAYSQRISSATSPLNIASNTISISQANVSTNGYLSFTDWNTFNNKQNAGNYITSLTGEATGSGPGATSVTLSNSAVIAKILTGLNITGGSITSSDSILTAFGKVQNQINGLFGGVMFQGTWDAATNDPTLTSSVGVQGYYYIVNVAGNTDLDGITDWNIGDWAIFDGSVWQQVDNTDSVVSVNGFTGIVSLATTNIPEGTNLYYTDARSRLAFSSTVTGLSYNSITGVLSTAAGYSIPTTAIQTNWNTAYNDRISALTTTGSSGAATLSSNILNIPNYTLAGLGGVPTSRTLTINGVTYDLSTDRTWTINSMVYPSAGIAVSTGTAWGTSIVDNSTNWNIAYTERISSATAPLNISSNVISISQSGAASNGYLSSTDWNTFNNKQVALSGTGLVKSTAGVISYITDNSSNWNTAYNDSIVSAAVTGTTTKTLTLTQQDSGTVTASWTDLGLTSVGLTMPAAFIVSNSPLTSNGTLAVTAAGVASQYIRGDGTLANFPTSGGGGGGVSYYLNGGTSQGTIGGNPYYQMSKSAVVGSNADFTINANGYIANFITDAGDPALLNIPAGNWNFEIFFSASSGGGSPSFYVELYKYNGTTFTLIASDSANPEGITGGTAIDLYTTAVAVPATTLTLTDRLAVRIYVIHSGRTITLHTQGTHLCQVITTFSAGITALNGLTSQVQYFQTGTSGTDFNISSVADVHTFNLPTASAINRGALSAIDWATFNSKQNQITLTTTGTSGAATFIANVLNIPQYQAAGTYVNSVTASSPLFSSGGVNPNITIQQANSSQAGYLSATDWNTFNDKQVAGNYITALTGEATATGPGSVAITLSNSAVIAKILTGLNITGGTVVATDSILTAFGKVQNQINSLVGGTIYKGTWNASTNNPFLASGVGTKGWYYIVNVAGSTNLDGITDWNIGDWAIFDGTAWQKVDNTDSVTSVNGFTGAVSLTTTNIAEGTNLYFTTGRFDTAFATKTTTDLTEGTNLYFTDARARAAISLTTLGTSGAATYSGGVLNIPQYQAVITDPVTGVGTANYVAKWTSGTAIGNSSIYDNGSFVGIGGITALGGKLNITFNSTTNDAIILKDTRAVSGSGEWRLGPGSGVIGFGIYSDLLGYSPFTISTTGAATFTSSVTANSFVKSGGTSAQFLLADGSVTTLPTANWNMAYDNMIVSASVTGTTTKTLTLTQQDGGTITASWTDDNTDAVTSVFGRTGAVVAVSGDYTTAQVTESGNLYFTNARAIASTLTGYVSGAGTISGTDTILTAIEKLNGNIGNLITGVSSVNGQTGAVTLTTSNISEGTNLYFTDTRAQNAITLTTSGTGGAATYSGGVLNIPQYQSVLTNPVTGTGTINYIAKWIGGSAVGNSIIFDNGTLVTINGALTVTSSPTNLQYTIINNDLAVLNGQIETTNYGTYSRLRLFRASGTQASPTIPSSGTAVGRLEFGAYNSATTTFIANAKIEASMDLATGPNDLPSRLTFFTTPDGSVTMAEIMRLDSVGRMRIGGTTMNMSDVINVQSGSVAFDNGFGLKFINATGTRYATIYSSNNNVVIKSLGTGVLIKNLSGASNLVTILDSGEATFISTVNATTFIASNRTILAVGGIYDNATNGNNIGIGFAGGAIISTDGSGSYVAQNIGNATYPWASATFSGVITANALITKTIDGSYAWLLKDTSNNNKWEIGHYNSDLYFYSYSSGSIALIINDVSSAATFVNLAGTGSRMVVADASGTLSTQAIPTGSITGSGTTNFITKWTGGTALGDSIIFDNGTNVGFGTITPNSKVEISTTSSNPFRMVRTGGSATNFGFEMGSGDIGFYNYSSSLYGWYLTSIGRFGINSTNPQTKFEVYGGHSDTTARLYSTGNGSTLDASLDMWASEPGLTYDGSGIGNNVNGSPFYGRRNSALGQSYIRFYQGQIILYTGTASANQALIITATSGATFSSSVTANNFIVPGGTSAQFLKADGSLDSNTYVTSGVLAGYLPLTGGTLTGDLTVNTKIYVGTHGCYLQEVLVGGVYELQVVDSVGNRTVLS